MIRDKDNQNTGKAILKMPEKEIESFLDEYVAQSIQGVSLQFRRIESLDSLHFTKNADDVIKVYVSGVHYGASENEFKQFVDSIILCEKIEMPTTHQKKSKGFAMVWFNSIEDANLFIRDCMNLSFYAKKLKCKLLETKVHSSKKKNNLRDFVGENSYDKVREDYRADIQKRVFMRKLEQNKYAFKYGSMEENLPYYCLE